MIRKNIFVSPLHRILQKNQWICSVFTSYLWTTRRIEKLNYKELRNFGLVLQFPSLLQNKNSAKELQRNKYPTIWYKQTLIINDFEEIKKRCEVLYKLVKNIVNSVINKRQTNLNVKPLRIKVAYRRITGSHWSESLTLYR